MTDLTAESEALLAHFGPKDDYLGTRWLEWTLDESRVRGMLAAIEAAARAEGAAAERARIAAALPRELSIALADPDCLLMADSLLAHPAVRAVLQPEEKP